MLQTPPLFRLGFVVATPGAVAECNRAGINPALFVDRHVVGQWGEVDEEDWQANQWALENEARLLSAYRLPTGVRIWVITEADRSSTCVLLPSEY